jgi:hypothetical protein
MYPIGTILEQNAFPAYGNAVVQGHLENGILRVSWPNVPHTLSELPLGNIVRVVQPRGGRRRRRHTKHRNTKRRRTLRAR